MVTVTQSLAILVTTASASSNLSERSFGGTWFLSNPPGVRGNACAGGWLRLELLCLGAAASLGEFPGVAWGGPGTPGF